MLYVVFQWLRERVKRRAAAEPAPTAGEHGRLDAQERPAGRGAPAE
jgi:hypothetical protein